MRSQPLSRADTEGQRQGADLHQPCGRDFHEYAEIIEDINRTPRRDLLTTLRLVLAGQK
jgi:hypothetical protein